MFTEEKIGEKPTMHWFSVFLRGIAMGAADVVPGVSGGTIAFITGIYERLINAIAAFTKEALPAWRAGGVKAVWKAIDGWFLVALGAGIVTSFLTLARFITWALAAYPQLLWSFFFGLVLASSVLIWRLVKQWNWKVVLTFVVAAGATWWVTSATPTSTPDALWFIFVSGMIAISAMILPGISGSFMLVLLGKYSTMLEAIESLNVTVIIVFLAGCAVGIATASRVIGWLFRRYHDIAVSAIVGIMLGSLNKIWPWKQTLTYRTSHDGTLEPLIQTNVWPTNYEQLTGMEPYTVLAILCMLIGLGIVAGVEMLGKKKNILPKAE